MAKINKLLVGESLVGEGNEVAHIDLIIGPRGSAAESAFANALVNNKDGFTTLLAVIAPNLLTKPNTILFNKVTIKGAKQAVQLFGPAQHGVAKAVADSVAEGVIPVEEADDLFISVGVFIHWDAADDKKIQEYNYTATREALAPAPSPASRRSPKSSPSATKPGTPSPPTDIGRDSKERSFATVAPRRLRARQRFPRPQPVGIDKDMKGFATRTMAKHPHAANRVAQRPRRRPFRSGLPWRTPPPTTRTTLPQAMACCIAEPF